MVWARLIDLSNRPNAGTTCLLSSITNRQAPSRCSGESWITVWRNFQRSSHSEEAVSILTQVADTPLMWICRGLLLKNDLDQNREQTLYRAADAYRASLQVTCLPSALLLTCRRTGVDTGDTKTDDFTISVNHLSGKEAFANMCLFSGRTSGYDLETSVLGGKWMWIMDVDNGVEVRNDGEPDVAHDLMREGIKRAKEHTSIAVKDKELTLTCDENRSSQLSLLSNVSHAWMGCVMRGM